MITDKDRIDWMEKERKLHGTITFERYGSEWTQLFSVSSQWTEQLPTIRAALDKAIELSTKEN